MKKGQRLFLTCESLPTGALMHSSEDQIAQLERLAQLHERGLLSDAEFQAGKRRILAGTSYDGSREARERRFGSLEWVGTGAAAFATLLLVGLYLKSTLPPAEAATEDPPVGERAGSSEYAQEEQASADASLCGSKESYAQLKEMIFDKAAEIFGGDPVPLNSLRRAVSVRMELPVVAGVDEKIQRTDCSGRLVLDLPPGTREAFDGEKSIEADLQYSFQPAADGQGSVIRAEGIGFMIQRLVGAATLLNAARIASAGGPQLQKTYNPSFDCGRQLTNVERMICQDEQLAAADRIVSERYVELREAFPTADLKLLLAAQRAFLKQRALCADTQCIRGAYVAQWSNLQEFASGERAASEETMDANVSVDANTTSF